MSEQLVRTYVLDRQNVTDLRTGVQTSDVRSVLDGDLDQFIRPTLLRRLAEPKKRDWRLPVPDCL
jgi:protein subunit release factor B